MIAPPQSDFAKCGADPFFMLDRAAIVGDVLGTLLELAQRMAHDLAHGDTEAPEKMEADHLYRLLLAAEIVNGTIQSHVGTTESLLYAAGVPREFSRLQRAADARKPQAEGTMP